LPTAQYISGLLNVSPNYSGSLLKSITGQTTKQHIHNKLIEKDKEKLSTTDLSVSEIACELGFGENYLIGERIKLNEYSGQFREFYFWRTYDGQEIDLIESDGNTLAAFEFKWNAYKRVKAPGAFAANYPKADFITINPGNYLEWIEKYPAQGTSTDKSL